MLESWGCGLYTSAAYIRVFTVVTNTVLLSLHEKLDYINLLGADMVQKGAITEEIEQGKDGKYHICIPVHTGL